MSAPRLEILIWVLIYGGLLGIGLGVMLARTEAALGTGIAVVGGIVAAAGFVLIWVRSRMKP